MVRGIASWRQADLTRAIRAARAAGVDVARVEIDPATGKITIIMHRGDGKEPVTDLDTWMASHARSS